MPIIGASIGATVDGADIQLARRIYLTGGAVLDLTYLGKDSGIVKTDRAAAGMVLDG
jgi:hypothetical protein